MPFFRNRPGVTEEAFQDRALSAIDDGFLEQIKMQVGGIILRVSSGEPVAKSVGKFGAEFTQVLDAREKALALVMEKGGGRSVDPQRQ